MDQKINSIAQMKGNMIIIIFDVIIIFYTHKIITIIFPITFHIMNDDKSFAHKTKREKTKLEIVEVKTKALSCNLLLSPSIL